MAVERTLSIIKPDAVAKNLIGKIYSRFESNGLKIAAAKLKWLSRAEAEGFYAVHRERPFFKDLVDFTIRADFAESIDANAVHGSDAPETAAVEVAFFFPGLNVYAGR